MDKNSFLRIISYFLLAGFSIATAMETGEKVQAAPKEKANVAPVVDMNLNDLPDKVKLLILKAGEAGDTIVGYRFLNCMSRVSKAWYSIYKKNSTNFKSWLAAAGRAADRGMELLRVNECN